MCSDALRVTARGDEERVCGPPIFQGSRPLIRRRPPSACRPARDQNARFGDVSPSALLDSGPALPAEPLLSHNQPWHTHTHTHTLTHSHWYTGEDHVAGAGACSLNPSPRLPPLHPGARADICTHCLPHTHCLPPPPTFLRRAMPSAPGTGRGTNQPAPLCSPAACTPRAQTRKPERPQLPPLPPPTSGKACFQPRQNHKDQTHPPASKSQNLAKQIRNTFPDTKHQARKDGKSQTEKK